MVLIKYMYNGCILKSHQLELLLEFNKYSNQIGYYEQKQTLFEKITNLNANHNYPISDNEIRIKLCDEYISGLFDSEGSISIVDKSYYVKITQKDFPIILTHLIKYFGFGKIDEYSFKIYNNNDILIFLSKIVNHLIVKYHQVIYFIEYLNTENWDIRNQLSKKINYEKHMTEKIEDVDFLESKFKFNCFSTIAIYRKNYEVVLKQLLEKTIFLLDEIKCKNCKFYKSKELFCNSKFKKFCFECIDCRNLDNEKRREKAKRKSDDAESSTKKTK